MNFLKLNNRQSKFSLFLLILLGFLFYYFRDYFSPDNLNPQNLVVFIQKHGVAAPLIYILLLAGVFLTFIPLTPFLIAGGLLFGLIRGTVFTISGLLAGSFLAFFLARFLIRPYLLPRFLRDNYLPLLEKHLQNGGLPRLILLRIFPVIPSYLFNYLLGLSSLKVGHFLWVTLLGFIPWVIITVFVGREFITLGKTQSILLFVLLAIFISAILFYTKILRRRLGFNLSRQKNSVPNPSGSLSLTGKQL